MTALQNAEPLDADFVSQNDAPYEQDAAMVSATSDVPARAVEVAGGRSLTTKTTRESYRNLADQLILDKGLWHEFFDRCKCFASVGMYGHRDPATVAAAGLKGMSLGMSFLEALDRIKVIHGTPVIRGPAAINHIHERCKGSKCRCIESTPTKAVWRMERPGWEPKEFTFTWEQAAAAGLTTKKDSAYTKYPARCLKWQAASEGAQEMFGDVLGGLYFQEELDVHAALYASHEDPSSPKIGVPRPADPDDSVEPTEEHPKISRVKELLTKAAMSRGATDNTAETLRKEIYREALTACEINLKKGAQPTLPQLDIMIAYLEGTLEGICSRS